MSKRLALLIAAGAGLLAVNLQADNVVALPSANSLNQGVSVVSANSVTSTGNFMAGAGAFKIVTLPDGTKSYVVANSGTNTVVVVDQTFSNPKSIGTFNTNATAMALTPDGKKLVVVATTTHVFDTSKDEELVPGGISTLFNDFDVAISLDGSRAFVLGTSTTGGSQLNVIDLATNTLNPSLVYGILGLATGVTVGLNGRVYVSTQNQIIELDPATLKPTTGGIISVNARPGKLVFTPDGKYALAVNQTPVTGQAVLLIDLSAHALVNFVPNFNVVLDTLLPVSSKRIFAYSTQTQGIYEISIGNGASIAIAGASIGNAPTTFVSGVAISNEVPLGGRTTVQYLFVLSSNVLYRIDLTVGQITGQTQLPNEQFGALAYLAPAVTGLSSTLAQYGDKQTVAPSGKTLPLVVRSLDGNGKPLSGVTITFSANVGTATLSPASATTGSDGFAETVLTAPATNGPVIITASDGKHSVAFTINVGTGPAGTSGGIAILAGQGQLLAENTNSSIPGFGSPLKVQITDVNGKPLSHVAVLFSIMSGTGTLFGGTMNAAGTTILTDASGIASAAFLSSVVPPGLGFTQTVIQANSPGTASVTFYETTYPGNTAFTPTVQILTPQAGNKLSGQAGTIIKGAFTALIVSAQGFAIPNVSVHALGPPTNTGVPIPGGVCNDPTGQGVLSDMHGMVACDLLLNGVVGNTTIAVEYGYHFDTKPFPLTITAGPPGAITLVQGNNQTGKPGQQLSQALVVQVADSFGNVLPFQALSWSVLQSGVPASLSNVSSATDATGKGSALVTLGATAGTVIIQVTAGNVSASFSLTVSNPAAGIQQVSGNNQTTFVNTAFAATLVVKVVDGQGNPISGAAVSFTLTSGSASLSAATGTTDANGQASTSVTAGAAAGTIVITAASSTFTTTFTLTAILRGPQGIHFVNGASFENRCPPPGCASPGEIVTVLGSGFATGVQGVVSGISILGPLPTLLAGVSITFNGVAAPIFYVANVNGNESLTVQVPFETPPGSVTVILSGAGGGSATLTIQVQPYAPGIFFTTYGNQKIATAVRPDGSYISPNNPAHRGETIFIFVTGLGQVSPPTRTNQAGIAGQQVTASLIVGLNNKGAPLVNAELAPGLVGVYILSVQVPIDTETGPAQPFGLIVRDSAGNLYFGNTGFIPIV